MIGRYNKMQTLSLDQEVSLWDGICYDIDFFQDFSLYLMGQRLTDRTVVNLIELIETLLSETASPSAGYFPQKDNGQYGDESSPIDWDLIYKTKRKERKQEKKWKKTHGKIKAKDANHNFDLICEDLLGDLYYE